MRKLQWNIVLLLGICLTLGACRIDSEDIAMGNSTQFSPILMTRTELEKSVKVETARKLKVPGKIYTLGNYIFISERYEGIHIIDNTDPENPINHSFVVIPGCVDMAAKGNVLYADNAIDLIALSIADINDIRVLSRSAGVLPELLPPDMVSMPTEFLTENRPENTIIIGWE